MVTLLLVKVTLLIFRLARWPAVPSKIIIPTLFAVGIATVRFSPKLILPVTSTSAATYGDGVRKKSSVLVALPNGVVTEIRPDVPPGALATMLAVDAETAAARVRLNFSLLLVAIGSKLLPVIVTALPAEPIEGVKPVITGAPEELAPTVKDVLLMAEPFGLVTVIGPVVAPAGTVVKICVVEAEVTVAGTPLNWTVF